jgi:enamine deaminase RidA (YjgF/YER057c/UK114 family)
MAGKGAVLPPGMPADPDAIQVPAIRAGRRVFLSGMRGDDVHASVENQARSAAGRLASCLHAAGLDWEDAVEVVIHVTDRALLPRARRAVRQAIGRDLPAGCAMVTPLVVPGAHVEVAVTACAR